MKISYPLTLMGIDYGAEINPIMYTKKKWQENSITPFYHNVIDEGISMVLTQEETNTIGD